MTDGQLALKAAWLAAKVIFYLGLSIGAIVGLIALVFKLLGPIGAALLYAGFVFFLFWLCAAIDLNNAEKREKVVDGDEK